MVQNAGDLADDSHLKERGFFIEQQHPEMGKTVSDATPIRLSGSPAGYTRAAPIRGQDNDYIYRGLLGMSEVELDELGESGII